MALFHSPKADDTLSLTCDWELLQKRYMHKPSSIGVEASLEEVKNVVGYMGWMMKYPTVEAAVTNSETQAVSSQPTPENTDKNANISSRASMYYLVAALGGAFSIGMYYLCGKS